MIQQNNDQTWFQQYQQQAPPPQQIKHDAAYNPDAAIDDGGGGWLDSAPGVAMEYKVHVDAAKEDCYWQYVHKGATFYMSSQVLKGIVMYQEYIVLRQPFFQHFSLNSRPTKLKKSSKLKKFFLNSSKILS